MKTENVIQRQLHGEQGALGTQYTEIVQVKDVFDTRLRRGMDPRMFRIDINLNAARQPRPIGQAFVWMPARGWVHICDTFEVNIQYNKIGAQRPVTEDDYKADRDSLLETAILVVFDGNK